MASLWPQHTRRGWRWPIRMSLSDGFRYHRVPEGWVLLSTMDGLQCHLVMDCDQEPLAAYTPAPSPTWLARACTPAEQFTRLEC